MLFSNNFETYKQKSNLVASATVYNNCAIACADNTSSEMRIAAPQAADELLGIDGVSASFIIFSLGGVLNISARSLGAYNVQLIMESMGGGGHQTMAGAQVKDMSIEECKLKLMRLIDETNCNL